MATSTTPTAPETLPKSMDYRFLRSEGLKHIQRLAGQLWTDYNLHDPGVTLLEALCFALTDLGLRTDWDMNDQLVSYAGDKDLGADFYAQQEILPNHPWTPLDFRKLIIDFPAMPATSGTKVPVTIAVQNVWLYRALPAEVPIKLFAKKRTIENRAVLESWQLAINQGTAKEGYESLLLNGLYETHLQFELNPELQEEHPLRNLNSNVHRHLLPPSTTLPSETAIDIVFPYWDEIDPQWIYGGVLNPVGDNLRADPSGVNQWLVDFKNAGTQGPVVTVGLNVEGQEDFVLELVHADVKGKEISRRNYAFAVPALYDRLKEMMGSNTITMSGVVSLGGGTFVVTLQGLHQPFTPMEITCRNPWTGREQRADAEFVQLISQQFGAWAKAKATVHKEALAALGANFKIWFPQYQMRLQTINDFIEGPQKQPQKGLRQYLCCHRNLCEDWVRFRQVPTEDIGLECEIILAPEADQETVLTEIYHRIGLFLSPMVQFQTLDGLLAAGKHPGEIFDGHLLQHGFIADEALVEETDRQHYVFTSDLVRIIMDVPGVSAINELGISGYIHGRKVVCHAENCLALGKIDTYDPADRNRVIRSIFRKPLLSALRSDVRFSRDGVTLTVNIQEVDQAWNARLAASLTQRIPQAYAAVTVTGDDMGTQLHQSIQNDLPVHYGTTQYGMSDYASDEHKGKVKQLKGYLLFFDQLLANYLSQLNRVRELFTFRDGVPTPVDHTYFVQNPDTVPGVEALLLPFQVSGTWPALLADLERFAEDESTYLRRRNIFLSHIAARFAESFAEYGAKLYAWEYQHLNGDRLAARQATSARLIPEKKAFLLDYPRLSGQRGKAFCIKNCHGNEIDVWDTLNVEGMKRRLCRLIGIADESRRYLTEAGPLTYGPPAYAWDREQNVKSKLWYLRVTKLDPQQQPLVALIVNTGPAKATEAELFSYQEDLAEAGKVRANYTISGTKEFTVYIKLQKPEHAKETFRVRTKTTSRATAEAWIDEVVEMFARPVVSRQEIKARPEEGLHVIEHILFRPKRSTDLLLQLPTGDIRPEFYDPYSFRVTVILPRWAGRFSNPEFGSFVEDSLRMEMPAHVHPWVIWVDDKPEQLAVLRKFEEAYKAWLETNALPQPNPNQQAIKHKEVVTGFNAFLDFFLYHPPA